MPIYEFECGKCAKRFEELLLKPDERIRCPRCSSRQIQRLFSGFAVHGGSSSSTSAACSTCSAKTCSNCQ